MTRQIKRQMQKKVHQPSAVLPVNLESANHTLANATREQKNFIAIIPPEIQGLLFAEGYQKGARDDAAIRDALDTFYDEFQRCIYALKAKCAIIDFVIESGLRGKQLADLLSGGLLQDIEDYYDDVCAAWSMIRQYGIQISGIDLGSFSELRPDIAADAKSHISGLKALQEGDTETILHVTTGEWKDLAGTVQKLGRKSAVEKSDYVTLEAIRYHKAGKSPNWIQRELIHELDSGKAKPEHRPSLQVLKDSGDPEQLIKRRIKRNLGE